MYSITENIYCSQLSSVAILLQPEPVSHSIIQGKDCVFSPYVLSSDENFPENFKSESFLENFPFFLGHLIWLAYSLFILL
jgi:hypothetical protein